jgi:hypothetical protein
MRGPPGPQPIGHGPAAGGIHQNEAQSESIGSLADQRPETES